MSRKRLGRCLHPYTGIDHRILIVAPCEIETAVIPPMPLWAMDEPPAALRGMREPAKTDLCRGSEDMKPRIGCRVQVLVP